MKKKLVAFMCEHYSREDALRLIKDMMEELQTMHEIPIVRAQYPNLRFETPNVIVKFVDRPEKLRGLHPDEIFNTTSVEAVMHRTLNLNPPYKGSIIDYIVETEKAATKEAIDKTETIDIVDFIQEVLGLHLMGYQKDILKECEKLPKGGVKVVYGKNGKIYGVLMED